MYLSLKTVFRHIPNTLKFLKNNPLRVVFSTTLSVFGNVAATLCLSCLVYSISTYLPHKTRWARCTPDWNTCLTLQSRWPAARRLLARHGQRTQWGNPQVRTVDTDWTTARDTRKINGARYKEPKLFGILLLCLTSYNHIFFLSTLLLAHVNQKTVKR